MMEEGEKNEEMESFAGIMNSSYYMSPLLLAYDDHLYNLERELKSSQNAVSDLKEENELLQEKLAIKMNEYGQLIAKTLNNSECLTNFEEEKQTLDERCQLLSEENQILFEQVAMLRSHFEQFNKDYDEKVIEAEDKIKAYDALYQEYKVVQKAHDAAQFTEQKLKEQSRMLGVLEESHKKDINELARLREERVTLQKELQFYREQSGKLSDKLRAGSDTSDSELKILKEREMHAQNKLMKVQTQLERERDDSKRFGLQLKTAKRDLEAMSKYNEDFQIEFEQMRQKDDLNNETIREYKDKLEEI